MGQLELVGTGAKGLGGRVKSDIIGPVFSNLSDRDTCIRWNKPGAVMTNT